MKRSLTLMMFLLGSITAFSQTRCFEFRLMLDAPVADWRDTACAACTDDPDVIADVEAQLALPLTSRNKMINGYIAAGDAGINRNGSHRFKWHFIPDQWALYEVSMEVCDGRPLADVDSDTTYWLHTVQQFCPWTSVVGREISPASVDPITRGVAAYSIFPNPATNNISLLAYTRIDGEGSIYAADGRLARRLDMHLAPGAKMHIDISQLPAGIYHLSVPVGNTVMHQKIIKQ